MADDYEFEEEDFSAQFNGGTLRRILGLVKPHWKWVTGFLFTIVWVSMLDAVFTYLSKRMIDEGIIARDVAVLREIVITYGGLMLVQAVGVFIFIYLAGVLGERVQYDLRKTLFNHLQTLSFSYFSKTPVGWIMSRVTSDSERIAQLVTWGMLDVTWAIVNIITSMAFMLLPQLAARVDRAGYHPGSARRRDLLQNEDPCPVSGSCASSIRRSPGNSIRISPACGWSKGWVAKKRTCASSAT